MHDGEKILHIPKESFPNWIWYTIECVIVIALGMLISREITDSIEGLDPGVQNYIFMGIVGIIFLIWYIGIRGFILKKKILKNSY
jgi:bacteriorhodopsin